MRHPLHLARHHSIGSAIHSIAHTAAHRSVHAVLRPIVAEELLSRWAPGLTFAGTVALIIAGELVARALWRRVARALARRREGRPLPAH